nr:immunoglobulin heavy chain junction region [Macaca mulatta]MOW32372.1 immunoglobulin heavy chain junction region [Macaca mulatta]MOW32373.1 immunoglobulin heavy chain junction region [Macaca mulatta]MOW32465.1 immunoglobulin heavy chain junction region [Macaca mulatta]MOW32710.1 immunoglobulin heavy chain junction region [Macaca mulatta]
CARWGDNGDGFPDYW